jgi:hypothetical protein
MHEMSEAHNGTANATADNKLNDELLSIADTANGVAEI